MRKTKWIFLAPLAILGFALFAALGALIVMLLWNWLMPAVFGWRAVTFWQALGLLVLCRILFGGIGHRGMGRSRMRSRMARRWERMTPEERERFRAGLRTRCGGEAPHETTPE
jgi:hypothetical protein